MRVVLFNLVDNEWLGGINYLRNTFAVMRARLSGRVEPRLVVGPRIDERHVSALQSLLPAPITRDETVGDLGRGSGLPRSLLLGRDARFERLAERLGADMVFETGAYFGWRCRLPVLSWIPDFQHRHLPAHFSRYNWLRRETSFRVVSTGGRTIMLSSENAKADLGRFYPPVRRSAIVVPFSVDVDPAGPLARAASMRGRYDLPARFVYCPNQFWTHKNHTSIVEALRCVQCLGEIDSLPPIILTGPARDPRDPGHYDRLMEAVAEAGLGPWFRHLGTVPFEDVLALAAAADTLLNPSLFEGWSTTVEEAKALGTPLILSDLGVHREQAPDALFFDPHDPAELAERLLASAARPPAERPSVDALRAAQSARRDLHAERLWTAVERTMAEAA